MIARQILRGGLHYDVIDTDVPPILAAQNQSFGVLSWGSTIHVHVVRINKTFHVIERVSKRDRRILQDTQRRTGVRIVFTHDMAFAQPGFVSTDPEALLAGAEAEQVQLLLLLLRRDPQRPAPSLWQQIKAVHAIVRELGVETLLDAPIVFEKAFTNPELEDAPSILQAAKDARDWVDKGWDQYRNFFGDIGQSFSPVVEVFESFGRFF